MLSIPLMLYIHVIEYEVLEDAGGVSTGDSDIYIELPF